MNNLKNNIEPSKRLIMSAALAQTTEPDLVELLDTIEHLRAVLYRFTPLLDSESVEVVTLTQAALKTIGDEISRVLPSNTRRIAEID
jgi:hypothetical protein